MNGKFADSAVDQDNLTVQFSLRLPQTVKGQKPNEDREVDMDDTCKRLFGKKQSSKDNTASPKGTSGEDGVGEKNRGASTPDSSKSFDGMTSPKMDRLLGSNGRGMDNEILLSYYGELDFIDNQAAFDKVFGKNPELLPHTNPNRPYVEGKGSVMSTINSYADKCMFDKFIAACCNDYVGDDGDTDPLTVIQDICDTVSGIKQVYKQGNRIIEDHPEIVFQRYLDAVVGLPDDATSWSIQLCSTYYGALTDEVRNHMLKSKFKMPKVNGGFTTKRQQLQVLRSVRSVAVSI